MKIVFFGTDNFAKPILEALLKEAFIDVIAVVTQPDSKRGRGQKLQKPPIAEIVPKEIPLLQPEKIIPSFAIKSGIMKADVFVVVSYGKIIPELFLEMPKYKTWNVHPSLLPKHRGPSPIATAILKGDKKTGTSIMILDEKIDHGPILGQKEIKISPTDTTETLSNKLTKLSADLLISLLKKPETKAVKQIHSKATFTKKFQKKDFEFNSKNSAEQTLKQIRAFPGKVWFLLPNKKRCKIFLAKSTKKSNKQNFFCDKNSCYLKCSDKFIEILELQIEGKTKTTSKVLASGYKVG